MIKMNKEEVLNTFLLANIPEIITQEEFDDVKKAIKELQQENKKYKEVIDKEIEYIKEKARNNCWIDQYESCDLIKILKEVE